MASSSSCFLDYIMILAGMMMIMSAGMGMGATPRKAMNEPFARNYVPTWALDHIKDFNAGSEIHLYLDNRTGIRIYIALHYFAPIRSDPS